MPTIRVESASAVSELEILVDGGPDAADDPDLALVVGVYDPVARSLVFPADQAGRVVRGLCALSNRCDELGGERALSADERTHYRRAARAFATLQLAVSLRFRDIL